MLTCYHCGAEFSDDLIEAMHAMFPDDVPMERHGEAGVLFGHAGKPELCETCRSLPRDQLVPIIQEMTELTLRKHYGRLS